MRRLVLAPVICLFATGCACMDYDNLRVTKYLDSKTTWINRPSERLALSPLVLPVGLSSVALDVFLVHPVTRIPGSIDRTYDLLWRTEIRSYYLRVLLFIPSVIASPVYFMFDLLGHSVFDLDDPRPSRLFASRMDDAGAFSVARQGSEILLD